MSDTTSVLDADDNAKSTDPVVRRAHRRFAKCQRWESTARNRWKDDRKFANGDAYNNYQWPDDILGLRTAKPSLTVNETQQHNLHIINEAKQNKSAVKYRPIDDGASAKSAEVMEGIYRHISNISNAQMAQGVAIDFQVEAGLGFTVIRSEFIGKSFNQEIYIRTAEDPMSVYLDPDANPYDGSGARFGFEFSDRPRDEVEEEYPQFKNKSSPQNAVDEKAGWIRDDHIREALYYEVSEDLDELLGADDGVVILRSQMLPELIRAWEQELAVEGMKLRRRKFIRKSVTCYKIIGDECVSEDPLPGESVPIVPWVGSVTVIDGELDRKGHTRTMLSAQQMINYNSSGAVEFVGGQTKTPWLVAMEAINGGPFEYWKLANVETAAVLPYNHVDQQGNPIPVPTKIEPPVSSPGYMDGITLGRQFMFAASGQYETEMGAPGNERSGRAINERERLGSRATYHFTDNQALAIRRQGQIVKEWIPFIYDTKRVLRIIGEDDSESHIQIDPEAAQAHQEMEDEAISGIFNPNIGTYEVVSDVGPDWATQRQEAFNAIVQILTQAPELINKIGDLLFKVADFPLADQIAERLKPGLAPEAQIAIQSLQDQLAKQNKHLGEAMQALAEERIKAKNDENEAVVKAFDADTKRLDVIKDLLVQYPEASQALVLESVAQALQDNLGRVIGHLTSSVTSDLPDTAEGDLSGQLPIQVPNVGEQAARPGGE